MGDGSERGPCGICGETRDTYVDACLSCAAHEDMRDLAGRFQDAEVARDLWAHQCNMTSEREADLRNVVATLTAERDEARAKLTPWEDGPQPEDEAIHAAHPTRSGNHEAYAEAMRLVGSRHSKGSLIALVTWLLLRGSDAWVERDAARAEIARLEGYCLGHKERNAELEAALRGMLALAEDACPNTPPCPEPAPEAESEYELGPLPREDWCAACTAAAVARAALEAP